jgi:hypothetical protein
MKMLVPHLFCVVGFIMMICASPALAQGPITLDNPTFFPETGDGEDDVFVFNVNYINTSVTVPIGKFDTPNFTNIQGCNVKVAVDSESDIHIVFMRYGGTPENWEIYYQEMEPNGTPKPSMPNPIQISDDNEADSIYPVIALDKYDDSHIAWIDLRDGNNEIYYAKVDDETGNEINLIGSEDILISSLDNFDSGFATVPSCPCQFACPTSPYGPDIACASYNEGGEKNIVHIAWSDARNLTASNWEVYYQYQDAITFGVYEDDMAISEVDEFDSQNPAIATGLDVTDMDREKQIHFVWEDTRDGAWWEIYYEHGSIFPYDPHAEKRISGLDDAHSREPDIDCEKGGGTYNYIHVVWTDERTADPGLDPLFHFPGNAEIYTTILEWSDDDDPQIACPKCGPKRQSDIWGGDWYGPFYHHTPYDGNDGSSVNPQIVVDDDHWEGSTHIVWQNTWLIGPYPKVMYTSVPNGCNNPATDVEVISSSGIGEGFPSIAMGPDGLIEIKFTRPDKIVNVQKSKGKYLNLVLTTSGGAAIASFDMYPNPHDSNAVDGIDYHVGLPLGTYAGYYMIDARDSLGNTASTDVLSGPALSMIPTLNQWGLMILLLLLVAVAVGYIRRSKVQT